METRRTTFSKRTLDAGLRTFSKSALVSAVFAISLVASAPSFADEDKSPLADAAAALIAGTQQADATPASKQGEPSTAAQGENPAGKDQFVRVGVDDRITLHMAGLPLADAMRMLSEPTKRNIILGPGAAGEVSATLYDATFEEALNAMLIANGLGYRVEGNFIFVHPVEDIKAMRLAAREVATRVFKLSYVRARDVQALLKPLKSENGSITNTPEAKIGLGGETGPADTEGDQPTSQEMIIVTDYVDVIERMARVIREVDLRPRQVLIESTILRATLNENNALGIDFTTVGGIDFTALESVSPAAQSITTGNTPVQALGQTTFTARTELNGTVPNGGFTFGIVKDQISLFVRALESVTDTDVIANPKVLALNKQYGQVIVGRRDGYITTTITETTATQTIEFLETGTILSFRPFIGDDGYVRMEIHPKDSTGGLTADNLPFEQTTEVTTNIMVRDGNTILIGGLFREVTTAARDQVPGAGDIPILGALFRATADTTVREEVIVLLTVHIVKDSNDYEKGESLYQDAERIRMLSRQGVQPIGRERLSELYFGKATAALEAGDVDGAAWYARMALNHFPRNLHALKLLERINGRRAWESEASSIRSAVRDLIVEDRGEQPKPEFGRPGPPFEVPDWLDLPSGGKRDPAPSDASETSNRPSDADGRRATGTMREVSP